MAPHAEERAFGASTGPGHPQFTPSQQFEVNSPRVQYTDETIQSKYTYHTTSVRQAPDGKYVIEPKETVYDFQVRRKPGRVGMMLVGWGGNNGSTVTGSILANRHGLRWETRQGTQDANYYGSMMMSSTVKLGVHAVTGQEVNIPFCQMLPMLHPSDLVIGGWDISGMNLAEAMDRAQVLEPSLKAQLRKTMTTMKPLPSIYYPDFIAANQGERADNLIPGSTASMAHVEQIRTDIRTFKATHMLDKVIVLWTANTERFADLIAGINDSADNLLDAIDAGHSEISPSTIFAVASILENAPFINGSPQNTFVPGVIKLAKKHEAFIGGDDFKSGQTKMKSALVDFMINAGLKLTSIASYNHLGNNDGMNLSSHKQFRSKEISKSNVVDDMVEANHVLYTPGEHPDHTVVIKYMPAVGDSKRALDEYHSEIFMGGHQTISMFNVCEDSLLASPLIIDLVLVTELMTRISWKIESAGPAQESYKGFHSVLSILSYMLKAPLTPPGTPVVNALAKQRAALTNIFRACIGLQPESDMTLEHKLFA